jgi:hypothetical protein
VAQIVPAYIAYTSTLEQRFKALFTMFCASRGCHWRMRIPGPNLASLRRPYAVLLPALTMDSEGFYDPLEQIDASKR